MKLHARLLAVLALSMLSACAPVATIAEPDEEALRFIVLPRGDLAVIADKDIEYGDVRVAGLGLQVDSPHCQPTSCSPSTNGFIRLTFPDDGKKNYGSRIVIDVVSGTPEIGRALFTLSGESASREGLLQPPEKP